MPLISTISMMKTVRTAIPRMDSTMIFIMLLIGSKEMIRECHPMNVVILGSIARKYPFQTPLILDDISLSLSCWTRKGDSLMMIVKAISISVIISSPERFARRLLEKPYWLKRLGAKGSGVEGVIIRRIKLHRSKRELCISLKKGVIRCN